jgi:hypothetical protein
MTNEEREEIRQAVDKAWERQRMDLAQAAAEIRESINRKEC